MKHLLVMLPFLAAAAAAQEDVYKTLAPGDRVQITFRTGGTLIGTLVVPLPAGPLAGQKARPKAVDVRPSSASFSILFFHKKGDAASETQADILDTWRKGHPEAALNALSIEDAASADLAKEHNVLATPTIVLVDTGSGHGQPQAGLHSADRLEAGLARLRARAQEDKVDYVKESFLTLDVTWEYPGLTGTMALSKKDIKDLRKLQKLDEQTRKRLEEEHRKIRETQAVEEASRREAEKLRSKASAEELEKADKVAADAASRADQEKALIEKAAKLKTAGELLKQFPPEKWGDQKIKEINQKNAAGIRTTPDERAFLERYKEWTEAVNLLKEKKDKGTEGETPEKK